MELSSPAENYTARGAPVGISIQLPFFFLRFLNVYSFSLFFEGRAAFPPNVELGETVRTCELQQHLSCNRYAHLARVSHRPLAT